MRVTINLARQPYEDVGRFAMRWAVLTVVLAILTGALVAATYRRWSEAHEFAKRSDEDRAQVTQWNDEVAKNQAVLNQPANRTVREQSDFLNQLIARKAFSWTSVFADLERLVPARMHVVSLQPVLDDQNQLEVKLTMVGDTPERGIEMLRKLENSPQFRSPQLISVNSEQQGRGGLQFQVTAVYVPPALNKPTGGD